MGSTKIIDDLLKEAHAKHMKKVEGKTVVYRFDNSYLRCWKSSQRVKNKRLWKTICTQDNIKEDLLKDVKTFQASADYYHKRGIPYRRGYLLHGPPGTGKTSLVHSLVGRLEYGICLLNLSDMTDEDLLRSLSKVPNKCIVLIEEVDVAVPSKKRLKDIEDKSGKKSSLTFEGVLNAIDGIASEESQIIVMTTNHKDDLDPAFIRPGRVDREFYLGNCNSCQVQTLFRNFFCSATESDLDKVRAMFETMNTAISPAKLQGHLLRYKKNLEEALKEFPKLDEMTESLPDTPVSSDSGCVISKEKLDDALT